MSLIWEGGEMGGVNINRPVIPNLVKLVNADHAPIGENHRTRFESPLV